MIHKIRLDQLWGNNRTRIENGVIKVKNRQSLGIAGVHNEFLKCGGSRV
jgi:hypothetical protein